MRVPGTRYRTKFFVPDSAVRQADQALRQMTEQSGTRKRLIVWLPERQPRTRAVKEEVAGGTPRTEVITAAVKEARNIKTE